MAREMGRNFPLDGKAVFVAGAGGVGSAIARGLSEAGAKVFVADLDLAAAEKTARTIQKEKRPCRAGKMDILNPAQIIRAMRCSRQSFGGMDAAINCVGMNVRKPALQMTEEEWDRVLDVNLKGAFFFAQCAARIFIQQGRGGKIISIASILSFSGMEDRAPYGASKTGLVGLTKALAVEWAPYHISVNAVLPGYYKTELTADLFKNEEKAKWVLSRIPLGRTGLPEDLAGTIVFLSSEASDYITGQIIPVDGGWLSS